MGKAGRPRKGQTPPLSWRPPEETRRQIAELAERLGCTKTQALVSAVELLHRRTFGRPARDRSR